MVASKVTRSIVVGNSIVGIDALADTLDLVRDAPLLPQTKYALVLVTPHTVPTSQNATPLIVGQGTIQPFNLLLNRSKAKLQSNICRNL